MSSCNKPRDFESERSSSTALPPDWLAELADQVAGQFQDVDILAPIGCHYYFDEPNRTWEVTLFVGNTQSVGGHMDGLIHHSIFVLDLAELTDFFTEVNSFHWQALRLDEDDELGPHISIHGLRNDHRVWLRILAHPPESFDSGREARYYEHTLKEVW